MRDALSGHGSIGGPGFGGLDAMTATPEGWLLTRPGGTPSGPWSTEQVVQKIHSGELEEGVLCWKPGMAKWLPLKAVPIFRMAFKNRREASNSSPARSETPPPEEAASPRESAEEPEESSPPEFAAFRAPPRLLPKRKFPAGLSALIVGGVFVLLLAVAVILLWPPGDSGARGPLAELVSEYLRDLEEISGPAVPSAVRRTRLEEENRRFAEQLEKLETIELQGRVRDIVPAECQLYRVPVEGPHELKTLKGCKTLMELFVSLSVNQVNLIQKGDEVRVTASIARVQEGGAISDPPPPLGTPDAARYCPKSRLRLELNAYQIRRSGTSSAYPLQWTIIFGADSYCSIGPIQDIRVAGEPDSPRIRNQRQRCHALFDQGEYPKVLEEVRRLLTWVPEDPESVKLLKKTEEILRCIDDARRAEQSGDYFAAVAHWSKAREINPADSKIKQNLDRIRDKLRGDRSKTEEKLLSDSQRLIEQGKYDEAILKFMSLIEIDLLLKDLSPIFSHELVEKKLATVKSLYEQGKYSEAAAETAKLLQPDYYSIDLYSDIRTRLVGQLISRASSLVEREKFTEACTPLEKARQLETSYFWIDDLVADLHNGSRLVTLHGQMEAALIARDFSAAWKSAEELLRIPPTKEEELKNHFPAVTFLAQTVKQLRGDCEAKLPEIARQLLTRAELLNLEFRDDRVEAEQLLQKILQIASIYPRREELQNEIARARDLRNKLTELEKVQHPDLTGTWRQIPRLVFDLSPEFEIQDKGPYIRVELRKVGLPSRPGSRGNLMSFTANLKRILDNPRQLAGTFEAELYGRSSKFSARITITIPENETDRIEVRLSSWPDPDPGPRSGVWERIRRREPEPEPEPLFWQPGRVPDFPVKTFP